jgi:hypothetical protein
MEELKRQCEIRKLPYTDVKYLITEILLELQEKVEGKKKNKDDGGVFIIAEGFYNKGIDSLFVGYNQGISDISSLITEHIKRIEE